MGEPQSYPPLQTAPPTRPGEIRGRTGPLWPRVFGVFSWMVAALSAGGSVVTLIYPIFSSWMRSELGPEAHDDLAGILQRYWLADVMTEVVTIALAAWLCVIALRLWRGMPGSGALLRRWCIAKLAFTAINLGLLWAQSTAHFSSRADMSEGEAMGATVGMVGTSAGAALVFPIVTLAWLLIPSVRRSRLCAG